MDPLLVLFDIDGTLVDTAGAGKRSIERAFRALWGVDGDPVAKGRVRYSGRTDPQIFRSLAAAYGIAETDYSARRGQLIDAYLSALAEEMQRPDPRRRVLPGVVSLLDALAATEHVHLGLVTGNVEPGARSKLEPFGLSRYFPGGGFGSDHADRREIARLAHRRLSQRHGLDFLPSRVVVVGDTEHDVSCARANGFRSIAVGTGRIPIETLHASGPDALFSNLADRDAVCAAIGV